MEWKPDEIEGLRKKLSLSQRQLAKRLGVKRQTVACWESGIRTPSKKMIAELEKLSTKIVDRKVVDSQQSVDKSVDTGVVDSKVVDMVKNVDRNLTDDVDKNLTESDENHAEGELRLSTAHESLTDNNENLTADGENHAEGEQRLSTAHESLTASDRVEVKDEQKPKLIIELFRGREDAYGFGNGLCVKQPVTEALIGQHLRGERRIGIYNFSPNIEAGTSTWWGCFDIEDHTGERTPDEVFSDVLKIQQVYAEVGIQTYIEASKSDNSYHEWKFNAEPIEGELERKLATLVAEKAGVKKYEFFPKQDKITLKQSKDKDGNPIIDENGEPVMEWGYGNYVNLPLLGKELVEQGRTVFLNPNDEFKPYADQFEFLTKVHRHTRAEIEAALAKLSPQLGSGSETTTGRCARYRTSFIKTSAAYKKETQPTTETTSKPKVILSPGGTLTNFPATGPDSRDPVKRDVSKNADDNKQKLNPANLLPVLFEKCAFMSMFKDGTGTHSEELWYRFLTNIVTYETGAEKAYELSKKSPKFDEATTHKKIAHAEDVVAQGLAPHTCEQIIGCEGWTDEQCQSCIAYHRKSSPAGLPYILQGLENEKARAGILSSEESGNLRHLNEGKTIDEPPYDTIPDEVLDVMAFNEVSKDNKANAQDVLCEISLLDEPTPETIQTKLWDFVTDASYWTPAELGRFCDNLNTKHNITNTWLRGWKRAVITEKRKRGAKKIAKAQSNDDLNKPTISVSDRHMRDITADAIAAIKRVNTQKPFVFVRSGLPTRIKIDENGNAIANPLTVAATRGIMERAANFVEETDIEGETIETPVPPPLDNVNDFLSLPFFPDLPPLIGVSTAPMVAEDGTICIEEGYQPEIRYFYHVKQKVEIGDITPTPENVEKAKQLILEELLCDFPFADKASRANTIALMLTPFVRPIIHSATPLFTIDASTPGTGKSLLADIASMPFIPSGPTIMTAGKDDDEWRKRITARLMGAPSHILIDNVQQKLSSGDLSAALTANEWEDRILGVSATVRVPVRCTWIATGNNLELSDEIARRSVWIRLEANVERPWERTLFRHPKLRSWVRKHRGEIVSALLTLVKKWLQDGRPQADDVILGSYEDWVAVVGGILKAVGIDGFLENATELYDQLDLERQAWVEFFYTWAETYSAYDPDTLSWGAYVETDSGARMWETKGDGGPVGVKELFPLASHFDSAGVAVSNFPENQNEGLGLLDAYLGRGKERARKTNLGRQLQKRKGRIYGGYKLELPLAKRKKTALYQLTKKDGGPGVDLEI
jgi:DNA-binding XRE family transcriptional regulator